MARLRVFLTFKKECNTLKNYRRIVFASALASTLLMSAAAQRRPARGARSRAITNGVLSRTNPVYGFKRRRAEPALLFNLEEKQTEHVPTVFVSGRGGWDKARLPEGALGQNAWVFVGRASDRPEVWGITELQSEGRGPALELLSSRDGGRTWQHVTVNKVSSFATFDSFYMTSRGAGALTIQLTQDDAQSEGNASLKPGYYTYSTRDGGRSWTKRPSFSPSKPPALAVPLDGPEAYTFNAPPGADRVREVMRDLAR